MRAGDERVGVIGLGSWGTALADHLARKGKEVWCWDRNALLLKGIRESRRNPVYHSNHELHGNVLPVNSKQDVFNLGQIILVLPSSALSQVFDDVTVRDETLIVSAIKGIEPSTLFTPLQYCHKVLPHLSRLAVLSGPSFSKDVIHRRPAGVVSASMDPVVAREAAELFRSETMKVYLSSDPLGVEIGGIVKNVIALAVGISDGLELGDSARAALITRGLAEMMRLAIAMGAEQQTLAGLSGLGDLVMTATCDTSRNRTVGLRLGKGESLENILNTLGSTAEAVKTTPLVLQLANEHQVEMPITEGTAALLSGEVTADEMIQRFITRPMKPEF